jgi:hypothetical protein
VANKETIVYVRESIVDRQEDVIVKAVRIPFGKASLAHEVRSSLKEPVFATNKYIVYRL